MCYGRRREDGAIVFIGVDASCARMTQEAEIKPIVQMTETASRCLRAYQGRKGKPSAGLRVFVTAGGCSRLSYGMVPDERITEDDYVVEAYGAKLIVDKSSAPFIAGSIIDYKNEKLMGGGFVVTNPNAVSTCGCGESFRTG